VELSLALRDYIRESFKKDSRFSIMTIRDTLHPDKANKERKECEDLYKKHGNIVIEMKDLDA
jgi:hypothetical protein